MKTFLSLGSNLGDKIFYLSEAIKKLNDNSKISIQNISSVFQTSPVGEVEQGDFYNIVVEIETELLPPELLAFTQQIENEFGRQRNVRWGARTLDIDILLANDFEMKNEKLQIPHPEMHKRNFVLVPLNEIAKDNFLKPFGKKVSELLEKCPDNSQVTKLEKCLKL